MRGVRVLSVSGCRCLEVRGISEYGESRGVGCLRVRKSRGARCLGIRVRGVSGRGAQGVWRRGLQLTWAPASMQPRRSSQLHKQDAARGPPMPGCGMESAGAGGARCCGRKGAREGAALLQAAAAAPRPVPLPRGPVRSPRRSAQPRPGSQPRGEAGGARAGDARCAESPPSQGHCGRPGKVRLRRCPGPLGSAASVRCDRGRRDRSCALEGAFLAVTPTRRAPRALCLPGRPGKPLSSQCLKIEMLKSILVLNAYYI